MTVIFQSVYLESLWLASTSLMASSALLYSAERSVTLHSLDFTKYRLRTSLF